MIKTFSRFVLITAIIALLTACADGPSDTLSPLADDAVILAFGDSLTFGSGAKKNQSYPAVLAQLTQKKVVSSGVPGETSSEGLARLPGVLTTVKPDLVILCHGGNDLLRRLDKSHLKQHLSKMVELIQQSGAQVLLVGVPPPAIRLKADPLYQEVADAKHIPVMMNVLADVLSDPQLKADPIHPNAAGYQHIAEQVADYIQ